LKEFHKVLAKFTSSQVVSNLLRLISGLLVVRYVSPALYGQYTGIGVYLGYVAIGQLGVVNGLGRELPYQLGKGSNRYADSLASSAFAFTIFVSAIAFILFFVVGVRHYILSEYRSALLFLSYGLLAFFRILNFHFLPVLYRTTKDFDRLSRINLIFSLFVLLTVLLVYIFGFKGLVIRGVFLALLQFTLMFTAKPIKLTLTYSKEHIYKLFTVGAPIFLVGYITPLWFTLTYSLVFDMAGALQFGLFAIGTITLNVIKAIPDSVGGVIYPRMSMQYGRGMSYSQVLSDNLKPVVVLVLTLVLIGTSVYFLLPLVVPSVLPDYIGGIRAAQFMSFLPAIMAMGGLNHIYNVVQKQKYYAIALILGALFGLGSFLLLGKFYRFDLVHIPISFLIGTFVQQTISLYFLFNVIANAVE